MDNELRRDYYLDRHVIISAGRGKRPSDFKHGSEVERDDKLCFFCPGNEQTTPPEITRVSDGDDWSIRVFPNKFPAVTLEDGVKTKDLMPARGIHEIVVETPDHSKTIADLSPEHMSKVLEIYIQRVESMKNTEGIDYALIFKNHRKEAGASLSHTHTQIVSLPIIPDLVQEETRASEKYANDNGTCPFCDIITKEDGSPREIFKDENITLITPYASRAPFEAWIIPKKHVTQLSQLDENDRLSIAKGLVQILAKLKNDLDNPPYNFYIHESPKGKDLHLHIEILPKLSKWAGFELGAGIIINTMPPETACEFYKG